MKSAVVEGAQSQTNDRILRVNESFPSFQGRLSSSVTVSSLYPSRRGAISHVPGAIQPTPGTGVDLIGPQSHVRCRSRTLRTVSVP